jgi:spermidine/putrescine transport system substrate-binding protein
MTTDPAEQFLAAVRRSAAAGVPRRRVLQSAALGMLAVGGVPALAACGTQAAKPAESAKAAATDLSDTDKKLSFSNWALYMDVDEKNENVHPTLNQFKAKTGVTVTYVQDVNDSDSFYAKVAPALRAGQDTGRDMWVLPDPASARLIRQGYLQKIDRANTPNATANLIDNLASPTWDPQREYTTPWQAGFTGIAYNAAKVKEVRTVQELFSRPDLKGRVTVLTEWQDTMGTLLFAMGKDPSNFTSDDYAAAIDMLQKASDSGQIRQFAGGDYTSGLAQGTVLAAIAWSGDMVQLQADNPNLKFVQPDPGMLIWGDNMQIPNLSAHKKNAELLMNFYYDPKVAAQLTAYVQYVSPVKGTQAEVEKIDPTIAANPLIFPTPELLKSTKLFMGLDDATSKGYAQQFAKVSGA